MVVRVYVFTCLCEILCFMDESSSHVELYPECIWRHGNAVSRMNGITGTCHHTAGRGGGRGCGDVQEEDERAKVEETTREAKCTQDAAEFQIFTCREASLSAGGLQWSQFGNVSFGRRRLYL